MSEPPSPTLQARVARVLGWTPQAWRPVSGGYTPALRYVVEAGGERAFVKLATTPVTARMLRGEIRAYQAVRGAFIPRLIGWEEDEAAPLLIIEDLSAATWPPPWDTKTLDAVLEAIATMHAAAADLPPHAEVHLGHGRGWAKVADAPEAFLSLGLASADWLARALPALVAAEAACPTAGTALTHFDLRSDNMCVAARGAMFVDWSAACLSNPALDLGGWLPSLQFEGGPRPEDVLPRAPEVAAWVSGYFAARAGLPIIPDAPFVRRVQREQLSTALPWAARALKLEDL